MTFEELEFKPHPHRTGGIQAEVTLKNGYSASVIKARDAYGARQGLYEVIVEVSGTTNVMSYLTPGRVTKILELIESLSPVMNKKAL